MPKPARFTRSIRRRFWRASNCDFEMRDGLTSILQSGRPPGAARGKTAWRQYVSRLHDGDQRAAGEYYTENSARVLETKPAPADLAREN